jgi:hypothetical protein
MEGSLVAYKVFTNGSVLNASEINDNLMNQSVMVFSNSTARSAALTAPVEGMITYLEDTAVYENYDGTAWVSFGAAESDLLGTSVFTAQTSVALDNIFTADYRFYDYYLTLTGSTSSSLAARLRTSAPADLSTSTYRTQILVSDNTTTLSTTTGVTTSWDVSNTRTRMMFKHGTITNPFTAEATGFDYHGIDNISDGQLRLELGGAWNNTASSYAGIRFFVASGTMTGQLSIYGRKS